MGNGLAVGLVAAGVAVNAIGVYHNHAGTLFGMQTGGWAGFIDEQLTPTDPWGHYLNSGELLNLVIGITLVAVGHFRKVRWAFWLGLLFIALGITGYLWAFPFG